MRNAGGSGLWTDKDSGHVQLELDTITCCHCNKVVFVKPGTGATVYLIPDTQRIGQWNEAMGAFCRLCMKAVCLACDAIGTCSPFERKIERLEARDRFARQALKGDLH